MCVKSFFGILVILTSMFCVSCQTSVERAHTQSIKEAKQRQKPKPQPKPFKQAFLVNKSLGISSAKQLDGASVCLITGGKEEIMVSDYFKKNSMSYESVTTETNSESRAAYLAGRCDAIVVDSNANVSSNDKVLPFE